MQLGMIGLGRMGANMVRRLIQGGHQCVVFDMFPKAVEDLAKEKATGATSLDDFVKKLQQAARRLADGPGRRRRQTDRRPRCRCSSRATSSSTAAIPTTSTTSAAPRNSPPRGIHYVDVGTSGGVWGLERGYCMMIGGEDDVVKRLDPDLRHPRPRHRRHPAHPGPREARRHRRAGLSALRPQRRRPLRQDGAQRHRVRHHGRLRRRPEHPASTPTSASSSTRSTPRPRRFATRSTTSTTSTCATSPRSGGAAASSPRGCST